MLGTPMAVGWTPMGPKGKQADHMEPFIVFEQRGILDSYLLPAAAYEDALWLFHEVRERVSAPPGQLPRWDLQVRLLSDGKVAFLEKKGEAWLPVTIKKPSQQLELF